ncbi:pre-peptidase C-terminal domain-containing protein [Motilimonas pumila]|uniref:Phosphohydrolase n=1 Tax=Motilimonas pumila TaxID=2303987 RepID=A0A418YHP2_9GAMM|nr:pre-peptidase C-terminal domain-containing protein [Motilimonas pumila]RJG49898.1 phosphohydrolase [Motilimonas pumila]
MKLVTKSILLALATCAASTAQAGSQYHRLIWDASPQSQATIGFSPNGGSNHYVRYGLNSNDTNWTLQELSATRTFAGSLTNHFVKLSGLPANSPVYYQVCDSTGCGQKFWFKTAPNSHTPFVAIAGGDTRTGWTNRRNGNKLVAKIRPLFVMHGGDFTNANSASEMRSYLADWQLTFSSDNIDGVSFKRIYPFIPTHGNHEDNNYNTLCQVFGADFNQDGQCNANDTYGAFNVSPLLRVYTLNSQFKNSGWSSYASAMNNWLASDLASQGSSATWRIAQYHKPMFPHYTGKSDNTILHTWWAQTFYNNKMNLVVESDTHINKITRPLKPSGNGFSATDAGGTVFVGEGSWGAPARSANDPKSWTIDLASIQQFKVLSVSSAKVEVRTAQFSNSAYALSNSERQANPLALPSNVAWWNAAEVGEVLTLVKASNGLSRIDNGSVTPTPPPTPGPTPPPTQPPSGNNQLTNGVPQTAISSNKGEKQEFTIVIPAGAKNLTINISGGSGDADLYVKHGSSPSSNSYDCRPYKNGNTENCSFATPSSGTYYISLKGYSNFAGVNLTASFSQGDSGGQTGGETITNLAANKGDWQYGEFTLPTGLSQLTVSISGGSGDADLYLRSASKPTSSSYHCRPYKNGNSETCTITNPAAGTWHWGTKAYASYSGLTLSYQYQ